MHRKGTLFVAAALGFVLGLGSGLWISARQRTIPPSSFRPVAFLSEEKEKVPAQRAGSPAWSVGPQGKPEILQRLRTVADLNRKLTSKINYPLTLGEDLNPDFVALYDLSAGQVERLKAAIAAARQGISRIEARAAVISPKDDGSITITIPPLPTEGGQLYDSLNQAIADILGTERYAFYRDMGDDFEQSSAFDKFGVSQTEISVQNLPRGQANWNTNMDQKTGMLDKRVQMDPVALKNMMPLLYDRLVASGALKGN